MAKNRFINTKFWSDSFVIELNPLDRYLFLYFLTNEHTNICGIYELPLKVMSNETGIEKEMLVSMIKRLEGKVWHVNGWVYLKNFAKHQKSNESVEIGIKNARALIPKEILKLIDNIQTGDRLGRDCQLLESESESEEPELRSDLKEKMDINYETGEEMPEKPKSHKREDVIKLAQLFDKMASQYSKKNIVTPKSYFIVLGAMNTHKLKPKGILKIYKDWFDNPDVKMENKVNLSWCLGKSNINKFKVLN